MSWCNTSCDVTSKTQIRWLLQILRECPIWSAKSYQVMWSYDIRQSPKSRGNDPLNSFLQRKQNLDTKVLNDFSKLNQQTCIDVSRTRWPLSLALSMTLIPCKLQRLMFSSRKIAGENCKTRLQLSFYHNDIVLTVQNKKNGREKKKLRVFTKSSIADVRSARVRIAKQFFFWRVLSIKLLMLAHSSL